MVTGGAGGTLMQCVDTTSNPLACGGCGKICAVGEECQGGKCLPATTGCTDPTPDACTVGGGGGRNRVACVNFQTDPLNCGDCGNACAANQVCMNGDCRG